MTTELELKQQSRNALDFTTAAAFFPGRPIVVNLELWEFLQIVQLLDRICFRRKNCRSLLASRLACNLNAKMLAQVVRQLPQTRVLGRTPDAIVIVVPAAVALAIIGVYAHRVRERRRAARRRHLPPNGV